MEVRINTLTPELFLNLYTSVGWEPPCIEQVETALAHTILSSNGCWSDVNGMSWTLHKRTYQFRLGCQFRTN